MDLLAWYILSEVFSFVCQSPWRKLKKIESAFKIKVHKEAVNDKVTVAATGRCTVKEFEGGCAAFITFYQDVHIPRDEETQCSTCETTTKHTLSLEKCNDPKHWKIYGGDCFVEKFLSDLLTERVINHVYRAGTINSLIHTLRASVAWVWDGGERRDSLYSDKNMNDGYFNLPPKCLLFKSFPSRTKI